MAHTNVQEVLHALKGVTFPADKDELVRAAQVAGASDEVVRALRAVPPEEYTNKEDVARSVRVDPDSDLDLSPSQRAEQARQGGKPGQAQRLRAVGKPPVEDELDQ
ncbi:DUF2795 domain-containing protein [Streptomyces sp. NPDC048825]|uniref:DUF2795 domain-containing protein n=1 Tax=Streptomyces sp. NPDC048825 TaxID=3365592 RepID=UPI003723BD37